MLGWLEKEEDLREELGARLIQTSGCPLINADKQQQRGIDVGEAENVRRCSLLWSGSWIRRVGCNHDAGRGEGWDSLCRRRGSL